MILIEDLSPDERREFFSRIMYPWQHGCQDRRTEFSDRYDIATDSYDSQIAARISGTHNQPEVVKEMTRWSVGYFNLWKRCARKIAVAYKRKPRRRLDKRKTDSTKLSNLYRKVGFDAHALEWQRLSVIMNRIIVLVVPRKGEEDDEDVIDFEVVTGADSEVWIDPKRSFRGVPDILGTKLKTKSWNPGPGEAVIRTVDARRFVWWNSTGEVIDQIEHGLQMFPGADLISAHGMDSDWWDWKTWRAATKATIEVGMIGASMGWTRKTQCRKIIALLSNNMEDETPDGQNLADHERPLILRGFQFLVNDLNTGVEGFLAHIKSIQDEIAEQMTGAASNLVDPDPDNPASGLAGVANHEAIKEVRESQLPNVERFEQRMAILLAKMATILDYEDAVDPDVVKEKFRVVWPELAFLDTPEARIRVWVEETKFGISDQVDAMMERDGISEEEAKERLMEIAERRAELDAFRAARNQQGDPQEDPTTLEAGGQPGEDLAQVQGRKGGAVDSDGKETNPDAV
jgi:hypothetical protein